MHPKKSWLKIILLTIYIGIILIYLLTCLVPFLNPGKFWFIAVWGLAFPLLLSLVIISLVITAIMRSTWFFLSAGALLLSLQQLSVFFGVSFSSEFDHEKKSEFTKSAVLECITLDRKQELGKRKERKQF